MFLYVYGGTEDFFGGQFSFVELPVRPDEFGVAKLASEATVISTPRCIDIYAQSEQGRDTAGSVVTAPPADRTDQSSVHAKILFWRGRPSSALEPNLEITPFLENGSLVESNDSPVQVSLYGVRVNLTAAPDGRR